MRGVPTDDTAGTPFECGEKLEKQDFVVRFAGEGGQGVVTASDMLARAGAGVGYHVQTFATFPSQILGGPTWTQTRISTKPVLSPGDVLDVLVAFNNEAFEEHSPEVLEGGVVIYNSSDFTPEYEGHAIGLPINELAKQAGEARSANMVILGALSYLVDMPLKYFEDFVRARFKGRDAIVEANIKALSLGSKEAESSQVRLEQLAAPRRPEGSHVFLKGNEALSIGAIQAGLDFYSGYPISPATPILVFMQKNLIAHGKFAYQVSSEIEAISSLLGAGFAGKKAMSATAGPGLSLMSEGLGLAWMAEIPCVVVDVQRGGPATGLPTKTEQSDLLSALHPAHGDASIPVIAAGSVEECFYAIIHAINWAERYQGPVILLSEHSLAERAQDIPTPDLSKVKVETRQVYQERSGYERYEAVQLSPMPVPGGAGAYVANGSEHDFVGDTTHRAKHHIHMTERRFSKLRLLENEKYESKNEEEPVALVPWGGSKGPAQEALALLEERGLKVGWYYTMFLNPLSPKLVQELRKKELVLVPELNYQGQFSSILRSHGIKAESITQYTGLPFKVSDLASMIAKKLESYRKGMLVA